MHKFLLLLTACVCLAIAGPATARTTAEIAAVFNTGLAAYDAGRYGDAFKIWWALQNEDLAAMRNVAMMLRKGQGTAKDPKRAEDIYETAAEAGLPTAQADLADMLLKGEAGPPDLRRALPLLQAAAAGNHPVAQYQLGELYETGAPPLVPKNIEVAYRLYLAAASHGMKEAEARAVYLQTLLPPAPTPVSPPPAPAPVPVAAVPTPKP